mmetsp:Transcript_13757/g.26672  ORF Transcript_13757/g.26672 Transcript_13757/m.26672 type:complete len:228 (-) Transcript_13757:350-1033(-)
MLAMMPTWTWIWTERSARRRFTSWSRRLEAPDTFRSTTGDTTTSARRSSSSTSSPRSWTERTSQTLSTWTSWRSSRLSSAKRTSAPLAKRQSWRLTRMPSPIWTRRRRTSQTASARRRHSSSPNTARTSTRYADASHANTRQHPRRTHLPSRARWKTLDTTQALWSPRLLGDASANGPLDLVPRPTRPRSPNATRGPAAPDLWYASFSARRPPRLEQSSVPYRRTSA